MKTIVLLLGGMIFWYSCRKPSCARSFEFHFPATITSGDTFAIGDTLWMAMDLPNELVDHQTGELIDLREFDLYFSFGIDKMDTTYVNNAIQDFELLEDVGGFTQQLRGHFVYTYALFEKVIARKQLRLGVVTKKRGVYLMSLGLPIDYGIAEESPREEDGLRILPNNCYQRIMEHSGTHFEGGCVNYYLMEQYRCQQSSPTDTLTICLDDSVFMAHRGGHAFVVK